MKILKVCIVLYLILGYFIPANSQPPLTPVVDIRKYDQLPEDYAGYWLYLVGLYDPFLECDFLPATAVHTVRVGGHLQMQAKFRLMGSDLEWLIPNTGAIVMGPLVRIKICRCNDLSCPSAFHLMAHITPSGILMVELPAFAEGSIWE